MLEKTPFQASTNRLMADLAMSVPGDMGRMVRAMVGVGQDDDRVIRPPAGPIRWSARLLQLCCCVYGAPVERAVPVGACLALLGIASSVLDAAQDGHQDLLQAYGVAPPYASDRETEERDLAAVGQDPPAVRDGTPEPGQTDGVALIANASTALIGLAWQALLVHGPRYGVEACALLEIGQVLGERLVEVCEAQHRDLTLGRTPGQSLEEYDRIIAGKTGQIDATACEIGAVLAGAPHHRALWRTLAAERAVAQQLHDDYRDFRDDLLNCGQISHPILYGLTVADAARREAILTLLDQARSNTSDAEGAVDGLTALLRDMGAHYYTLTCMVLHRNRALAALESLQLPSGPHEWLQRWIMRVAPAI